MLVLVVIAGDQRSVSQCHHCSVLKQRLPGAVDRFALLFDDVALAALLVLMQLPRPFLLHIEFLEHHTFYRCQFLACCDSEKRVSHVYTKNILRR